MFVANPTALIRATSHELNVQVIIISWLDLRFEGGLRMIFFCLVIAEADFCGEKDAVSLLFSIVYFLFRYHFHLLFLM